MQTIKYINSRGQEIEFGIAPPLVLQRIEGTGKTDTSFQTQKSPFQDGRTYIDSKLEPREIFLQATILSRNSESLFQLREEVQRIFNPKLGEGALLYTTANGTKYVNAVADGTPVFSGYNGNSVTCQITLLCNDPFWYDVENPENSNYPVESPSNMKILDRGLNIIDNQGTAYSPLTIRIGESESGVTITDERTGDRIRTTKPVLGGEELVITTELGKRSVKIVRWDGSSINAFSYITMDSKFLQLEDGENQIGFALDGESRVELHWKNRYIGL